MKFCNDKLVSGKGVIFYPNVFNSIDIHFSSFESIKFEGSPIKEGELRISRLNADSNIWDPIIAQYVVNMASSPLSVLYAKDTLRIKLKTRAYNATSLKLEIFISKQDLRPHFDLFPRNLSHRARFMRNDIIKWEIDSIHCGVEYSIKFTKCIECFRIKRIESYLTRTDKLVSGLIIDKCSIKSNHAIEISKENSNDVNYQSTIEGTYLFDF